MQKGYVVDKFICEIRYIQRKKITSKVSKVKIKTLKTIFRKRTEPICRCCVICEIDFFNNTLI